MIVVGAGPVGLSLALGLGRAGRRVLVLEREATTAEHSRAPAIWPRSQEILSDFGVLEPFLAEGTTLATIRMLDVDAGRVMIEIPVEELAGETPWPQLLILPQSRTERLLLKAVQDRDTARVLFSARVEGVQEEDGGVRVTYRSGGEARSVEASFAVGADGAGSGVRESLGASFEGETYGNRAALADVEVATARDLPFPRLSTDDGLAIGIRMKEDLWRLILPFNAEDERPLDVRVRQAATRLFPDVGGAGEYETVWQSEFDLHRRVASRFVRGRIALAGDAAHLNSPVGGQGMNAGFEDAAVLTEALSRALDADDAAPLERYGRERRATVEQGVNRFTDRLTRLLLLGRGRAIKPAFWLGQRLLRIPPLRRRFLRRIAMLDRG